MAKYDWGAGGSGMASGAMAGGAMGGPLGALAGGGLGLFAGFGGGSNKMKKIPTMTKEQQSLLNQMMQMLGPGGGLGQGMGEGVDLMRQYLDPSSEAMQQFSQPYMNEFNQQTVPGLAERFAGMGGGMGGGLSSSGFGQSLSSAGGNLQAQLAQLKAGLGQQAAQSLMGQYGSMAGMGLRAQPFGYQQPQQSMGSGFLQSWGQAGFPGAGGLSNWLGNNGPIIGNV